MRRFPGLLAPVLLLAATMSKALPKVLVYTATRGYRHDSIPTAIETLGDIGAPWGVDFDFSEDETLFTNSTLSQYDGVMFVLNSDEVLDSDGQAALQTYFQSGGVYTGVHSGSACLQNDTTYQQAVGAIFSYHPALQPATFIRLNDTFPATAVVPDRWTYTEEVYNFRSDPRDNGAVVIMTVDESSYTDNTTNPPASPDGSPHPIAWYIESPLSAQPLLPGASKAGRSFYTSLGHLNSTWQNATFQNHLMSGLKWALDGASTRAYGAGLVGTSNSSSGGASASASSGTGASGTAGGGAPSASGSKSAATGGVVGGGSARQVALGAAGVVAGVVAGVAAIA